MKTIFVCVIFISIISTAFAQDVDTSALKSEGVQGKQLIRTAADVKSGASQDVLTSFFKLAYKDLRDGHHFGFNSSLFAIRAKSDSSLWNDYKYQKLTFARNFEFGVDVNLDSTFKFKSSSFNVKYAIINNRDKSIFDFDIGKNLDHLMSVTNYFFGAALKKYKMENPQPSAADFRLATRFYYYRDKTEQTPLDKLPERFKFILISLISDPAYSAIKGTPLEDLRDHFKQMYNTADSLMAQRSLWTVGSEMTASRQTLFNKINFNTEYLKGITKNNTSMGLELDIKVNLDIYDTTAMTQKYNRNIFSGTAGINWIIYKSKKTQKSYVEFKPALAYNNVLSGGLPGETKSKFTGDGVLRFRVTDDLWIPFDIKYDPKEGKFFGFLNITSNFDWLGGNKSKSSGSK